MRCAGMRRARVGGRGGDLDARRITLAAYPQDERQHPGPFLGRQDVLLSYASPEKEGPENAGRTHNRR